MTVTQSETGLAAKTQVNVVFHGLWAFETTDRGPIIAHTPKLKDSSHVFKVGSHNNHSDLSAGLHHLKGVEPEKSEGVPLEQDFDFDEPDNVLLSNKTFVRGKEHCSVELPPPTKIKSVRLVDVGGKHPFLGDDGITLEPSRVAMVQVFIYNVQDPESVLLEPIGVKPERGEKAWNLHFFAQPEGRVDPHHAEMAYQEMAAMFGLKIIPKERLFVEPSDPCITGLTLDDMKGLDEINENTRQVQGLVSGSNCDGLVIKNRSK